MDIDIRDATVRQLLLEIDKRIAQGEVKWSFTYYHKEDITRFRIWDKNDNDLIDKRLGFGFKGNIEAHYLARSVYKNLIEEKNERAEANRKEQENKTMEKLEVELKK